MGEAKSYRDETWRKDVQQVSAIKDRDRNAFVLPYV